MTNKNNMKKQNMKNIKKSMKKICELCKHVARMHCESDQANLCWNCDSKIHSANFLVARHTRTLLCHLCYSPTPWTCAGSSFGPTISVCANCFEFHNTIDLDDEESRVETENLDEEDEEEEVGKCDVEVDVDGGDYQVLPWSLSTPPANSEEEGESCSSCSSSSPQPHVGALRKRKREIDPAY